MRVLLDANVIIAAFATRGLCNDIFELCIRNHILITSSQLIKEVEDTLRSKLKLPEELLNAIISFLEESSETITPQVVDEKACRDPNDLHILGLAIAGKSEVIISGDYDLLELKAFQRIPILTPRQFWEKLQE